MPHRFNPRVIKPNNDPRIHSNPLPQLSLTESLGGVADDLRQIYTDLGQRPYTVHSVIVMWSGGAPGNGDSVVQQEIQLLPTPKLVDMKPVRGVSKPAGFNEEGVVTLQQISPRYTEDDIRALFHTQPLPPAWEGFLEIRVDERDGATRRRRFTVKGAPFRDAPKFAWSVRLIIQRSLRDRDGRLRDDVTTHAEVQMAKFGPDGG